MFEHLGRLLAAPGGKQGVTPGHRCDPPLTGFGCGNIVVAGFSTGVPDYGQTTMRALDDFERRFLSEACRPQESEPRALRAYFNGTAPGGLRATPLSIGFPYPAEHAWHIEALALAWSYVKGVEQRLPNTPLADKKASVAVLRSWMYGMMQPGLGRYHVSINRYALGIKLQDELGRSDRHTLILDGANWRELPEAERRRFRETSIVRFHDDDAIGPDEEKVVYVGELDEEPACVRR